MRILEHGQNNHILIRGMSEGQTFETLFPKLNIEIYGSNNLIEVEKGTDIGGTILIGRKGIENDDVVIKIGKKCFIRDLFCSVAFGNAQKISIGDNTTIEQAVFVFDSESSLEIGNDCMLSFKLMFLGHDGHAIFDSKGNMINAGPTKMKIGNHCWIGANVNMIKNAAIPDNSIVGISSMVNKAFLEPNVIIAGAPAKVVKKGVNWDRKSPYCHERNIERDLFAEDEVQVVR